MRRSIIESKEEPEIEQRQNSPTIVGSLKEMEYIKQKVEPIFSDMMVKIINEDPKDIILFMLQYLRNLKASKDEEAKLQQRPK